MIRPLGDRIVIKVVEDNEQTTGGIFIPDSAKEKPQKGEVIAVGFGDVDEKGSRKPIDVKVGEMVLYAKYAGTEIKEGNDLLKILSMKDVLGVIE
jgi:chaperonin GroES